MTTEPDAHVTITCALTGVLTNPAQHPVPVTPEEMAAEAKRAFDAGASVMHVHFRRQDPGMGFMPSWEPEVASAICEAIRQACPGVVLNCTTGVVGDDIDGPLACLAAVQPEMAALNAGSLNYLKTRRSGEWAWPPMLFDNKVDKIARFLEAMHATPVRDAADGGPQTVVPECECFDTGIVRSVKMFVANGMLKPSPCVSFVMGVDSGMPARPDLLPILIDELPDGAAWQTIAIGRAEVWGLHRRTAELGGNLRTGVEDTFYLPNGEKTDGNGPLIEALVKIARAAGREPRTPEQVRTALRQADGPLLPGAVDG